MNIAVETNLSAFNAMLARYMAATSQLPDDVLEKKGRDIGIRLFQKFREHRWRGSRRGRGIAWRELARRAKEGRGIRLRRGIQPSESAPETHMAYRRLRGASGTLRRMLVPVKTSEHQKKVFAELSLRQHGIGVLAASFLWFRRRGRGQRRYFVRNKTGRPLGYVEKDPGSFRIVSFVEGADKTSARYGIEASVLAEATADMVPYIERKEREAFANAFGRAN